MSELWGEKYTKADLRHCAWHNWWYHNGMTFWIIFWLTIPIICLTILWSLTP